MLNGVDIIYIYNCSSKKRRNGDMTFCSRCGKEIGNTSSFCSSCGTSANNRSVPTRQSANGLLISGWVLSALGAMGTVYLVVEFLEDITTGSEPPTELMVILVLVSLATLLGPIILGWVYKNKTVLMVMCVISFLTFFYFPLGIFALILRSKLKRNHQ